MSENNRELIQKRIAEYEREGKFDLDVEDDPPSRTILPEEIDYLNKSLIQKIKTKAAFFLAYRFANRAIRRGELIIDDILGEENLRQEGGVILTANHFSPMDSFIMHLAFDASKRPGKLYRIIKEGNYTSFPGFYGFLMRNCNTLPLSSNRRTMKKLMDATDTLLKRGECILIYPEQSMWYNYKKPKPHKIGAYELAARSGASVVPCFITMRETESIAPDGSPVMAHTVHFGKPILPDATLSRREAAEKMMRESFSYSREVYERVYGIPLKYETSSAPAGEL